MIQDKINALLDEIPLLDPEEIGEVRHHSRLIDIAERLGFLRAVQKSRVCRGLDDSDPEVEAAVDERHEPPK